MKLILSPWVLLIFAAVALFGVAESRNFELWVLCVLMIPVVNWLLGKKASYPILLWVIVFNWLQIIGDLLVADLKGESVTDGIFREYHQKAIIFSLCALLAMALGMRLGTQVFVSNTRSDARAETKDTGVFNINRLVVCYLVSLVVGEIVSMAGQAVPSLTQPLLTLSLLKFVCVYLLAAMVFEKRRGYWWLILVVIFEMAVGMVGYFASYKESVFVILIALASAGRMPNVRILAGALAAAMVVIWVSLVWTQIKQEYRLQVFSRPLSERTDWLSQRYLYVPIDYNEAIRKLLERVGYTKFYAQVLALNDAGTLKADSHYYISAVENILMPRVLFPDKEALDDSKKTTELLGIKINTGTSVGVGYITEAQVDFGFPGLLPMLLVIGGLLGAAAKYFMTRPAPLHIRRAFCTAALFLPFQFATNIDKALGALVLGSIGLALVLKFGYPKLARWLSDRPTQTRVYPVNSR